MLLSATIDLAVRVNSQTSILHATFFMQHDNMLRLHMAHVLRKCHSYCGVSGWLAALTNCWNIFLSFIGSIPEKTKKSDPTMSSSHEQIVLQETETLCGINLDLSHQPP